MKRFGSSHFFFLIVVFNERDITSSPQFVVVCLASVFWGS